MCVCVCVCVCVCHIGCKRILKLSSSMHFKLFLVKATDSQYCWTFSLLAVHPHTLHIGSFLSFSSSPSSFFSSSFCFPSSPIFFFFSFLHLFLPTSSFSFSFLFSSLSFAASIFSFISRTVSDASGRLTMPSQFGVSVKICQN